MGIKKSVADFEEVVEEQLTAFGDEINTYGIETVLLTIVTLIIFYTIAWCSIFGGQDSSKERKKGN